MICKKLKGLVGVGWSFVRQSYQIQMAPSTRDRGEKPTALRVRMHDVIKRLYTKRTELRVQFYYNTKNSQQLSSRLRREVQCTRLLSDHTFGVEVSL